ncbi:T9SS type A sorting domain-containing protein [bacterium BMS3Abin03]|nr:T9SS type A sorting domain-containing protein [bacterium BMS3Abin03]
MCYVDELTGYTYAKTYDIFEDAEYPDDGARNEVWINGNPHYFEVEVVSPVVNLPANGGSYTFTENWWAAKVNGPILSVTGAGAVRSFDYDKEAKRFTGEFGVFHIGKARLEFTDSSGALIDTSLSYDVTPLETFVLDDSTEISSSADSVHVVIIDDENNFIGTLVSRTTEDLITGIKSLTNNVPSRFILKQNYPNPFNATTKIKYTIPDIGTSFMKFIKIKVYDILGNEIATLVNEEKSAGNYEIEFDGSYLSSGIYFYSMQSGTFTDTKKFILMK